MDGSMEIVKKINYIILSNAEFVKRGICQVEKYTFQIPNNVFLFLFS